MKRIHKTIIFFVISLFTKTITAQQDPMYSMYMYDKMLINPAFAGSSNWAVATLKSRDQFTGISGHPATQTFNFHAPVQKKHIGIGFKIIDDKIALMSNLNVATTISYHLNFAGGKLSLGLEAGIFNRKINYQQLILAQQGDNVIPGNAASSVVPDASFGIYYQKKQFYAGISQYHLIKENFNDKTAAQSQSYLYGHTYFLVGNVFDLAKKWTMEPSMLVKYQAASPIQLDLNVSVYYNERIGLGLQYRTNDAVVTTLRVNITESLKIMYSYDMTLSKMSSYSRGAHEIIISYGIKLPPPPTQKEIHPRYYF
jgi:type IX secretion system PorP/SprF family membrane protein